MATGKFIVFEGIDGSGKTTQCSLLHQKLISLSIPCVLTYEPQNGVIGSFIRNLLHSNFSQSNTAPAVFSYLFAADRYEHVYGNNGIEEQRKLGKHIICDRYVYSSLAYQGNPSLKKHIATINMSFPKPDLVLYLKINIKKSLSRIKRKKDNLESEHFLLQVEKHYDNMFLNCISDIPIPPIHIIDASQNEKIIAGNIFTRIKKLFNI